MLNDSGFGHDTFIQIVFRLTQLAWTDHEQHRHLSYSMLSHRSGKAKPSTNNRPIAALCTLAMSFTITCQSISTQRRLR